MNCDDCEIISCTKYLNNMFLMSSIVHIKKFLTKQSFYFRTYSYQLIKANLYKKSVKCLIIITLAFSTVLIVTFSISINQLT